MNFSFLTPLPPRTRVPLFGGVGGGSGGGGQNFFAYSRCCVWNWTQVPGNHLAEVVRSKPGRRIYGENATYPPFWGYSHTLPQGVELLV